MGEPIRLYNAEGEAITVYTRSQAATMLAGGEWYASEADANAGKVREEPTPTTAAKLNALEGAGDVEDDVTVDPAPAPAPEPAKARTTRKATATRGKGGL